MRNVIIGLVMGYSMRVFTETPDTVTMILAGTMIFFSVFLFLYFIRQDDRRKAMSEYEKLMWDRQQKANQKTSMMMRGKWSDF